MYHKEVTKKKQTKTIHPLVLIIIINEGRKGLFFAIRVL